MAAVLACGSRLIYIQADVTDFVQVQGFVKEVVDQWGRIDILVNNVGTHSLPPYTVEDWIPIPGIATWI